MTGGPQKTIIDLGKKVKAKFPGEYDHLDDAEVGRKVKAKYPGEYDMFADVAEEAAEEIASKSPADVHTWLDKVLNREGMQIFPMAQVLAGAGKGLGEFGETVLRGVQGVRRQGMQAVSGQELAPLPPRSNLFEATNTLQSVGKVAAPLAIGGATTAAVKGAPLLIQAGVGGAMGATLSPDHPFVGAGLGTAPAAINMIGKGGKLAAALMRGKEPAAANFETAMRAAKDVPLDLTEADDIAIRALEIGGRGARTPGRGGTLPKVFSDYLRQREMAQQMTYEVGRDFAKNSGKLAVDEALKMGPAAKGEIKALAAKFSAALKRSTQEAATRANVGEAHAQAMKEYAQYMSAKSLVDALKKHGIKAAVGTGLGAYAIDRLSK